MKAMNTKEYYINAPTERKVVVHTNFIQLSAAGLFQAVALMSYANWLFS